MRDLIWVRLPPALVQKMIGPWYLLKKEESDQVREAFRVALKKEQ